VSGNLLTKRIPVGSALGEEGASVGAAFRVGDRVIKNLATWQPNDFDSWGTWTGRRGCRRATVSPRSRRGGWLQ
jgi:hypothetical protein